MRVPKCNILAQLPSLTKFIDEIFIQVRYIFVVFIIYETLVQ